MGRTWNAGLLGGIGLLVGLIVLNAGVAVYNTRQLHEHAYWVAHTQEVLDALDDPLSTVTEAETGQRGYVLTGEDRYLAPYDNARAKVAAEIDRLQQLTADNADQQERIPRLRRLVQAKLDELARVIALRRGDDGFNAARREVMTDEGLKEMEALRALVGAMRADERQLLADRVRASDRAYLTALVSGVLAALLGLAAVGGLAMLLRRYLTARERDAAAVHAQRELLRASLVSIGDGVIATDLAARVTLLNTVAQTLTGWTADEAVGRPLEEVFRIVNEATHTPVENPALRALSEGRVVGLANHSVLIARDGAEWPIDDSAAPIRDRTGALSGAVLVFREISQRKRQQAELRRQAEALREADRRKDEFLAMLAHELRNPLAPIRNALHVLRLKGSDGRVLGQMLDLMERQVGNLARLVDDLMDVTRVTRGKVPLRSERVDLARLLRLCAADRRAEVDAAGLHLTTEVPETPVWVTGDALRLTQVFDNLLGNAVKFTGRGGQVGLRLGVDAATRQAVVTVIDTGIGIDPEMLPRLFGVFAQADQSLDRSPGGLGLGLAIVKGLIELHGGTVAAASGGAGRGAEFSVRLPLGKEPPAVSDKPPVLKRAPKRLRILVVEDNLDAAGSLRLLLEVFGYEVTVAHTGPAGVTAAEQGRPDIVLCDIGLPGMDGYAVANALRKNPALLKIRLIAVTGYGQEEDRRRALEAGFDDHLVKPVDPEKLLGRLEPAPN